MDIFTTLRLQDDLAKLSHGSATPRHLLPDQTLRLGEGVDLALVIAGQLCIERNRAPALTLSGPSLLMRSEGEDATVRVVHRLTILPLSYESCAALVAKQKSVRDLFFAAMTARIRLFHTDLAPLIPASPLALH
ncbi:hypothetical protein [Tateyamaria sp. ANG-S1]|uniref:hypothetical protein n=1 Tax=Tateyamaria sp. ANG-S1 TaxID=1577905 RepID=UPI00187BD84F|nr:hypothetical protein [Tateyamaria sp. ANG-S1]